MPGFHIQPMHLSFKSYRNLLNSVYYLGCACTHSGGHRKSFYLELSSALCLVAERYIIEAIKSDSMWAPGMARATTFECQLTNYK